MLVKNIELLGFKTFAEKTRIEFGTGITAIVGPNGCGKSNIADALMWVLGESNVRNIRGQRATDVIFNGTDKRKALGMAEVSITFDNTCGTLPINFSEVTITRRAFRSGESEYFINKTRCRLKDIYELFLDTGMGREAYSFVTQGEIDAILSARPEDRRELLEEAAGIKKYRHRRQEALRKLEHTQANLNRVKDIMSEIGGQIEPLREQAEKARRYNDLQARLRDIEIGILIRDLKKHTESLDDVRSSREKLAEQVQQCDKSIADLEREREKQNDALKQIEEEIDNARRRQQALASNVQRIEGKAALVRERLKAAENDRRRAAEDIAALESKLTEAHACIDELKGELAESVEREAALRSLVTDKEHVLALYERKYEEANKLANDHKANYIEIAKELAAKRNALQNAADRVAQLEEMLKRYDDQIASVTVQQANAEQRACKDEDVVLELQEQIARVENELCSLRRRRAELDAKTTSLREKSSEMLRELASRSSRLSTLREMAEAHEGFFEGVRSVINASRSGKLPGAFAVVADVISVPKGYETAIETALGASVQDIIADSVEYAKSAIAFLKANRAGRATFLPLDDLRIPRDGVRGQTSGSGGALGLASEIVSCDRKYTDAIRLLLGRTVVAKNIDHAVELSSKLTNWSKIVTLEGELIVPSGAITGGAKKSRGPELLARKQELDTLKTEIAAIEHDCRVLEAQLGAVQAESSGVCGDIESKEAWLSRTYSVAAEHEKTRDLAREERARLGRQIETLGLERDECLSMLEDERANLGAIEAELNLMGERNSNLDEEVSGVEQTIDKLEQQRDQARDDLVALKVELAGTIERRGANANKLKEAEMTLNQLQQALEARRDQIEVSNSDVEVLSFEGEALVAEMATQRELLCAADARLSSLIDSRAAALETSRRAEAQLKQLSSERNRLAEETRDADVKEARLEVQLSQTAQRLLDEYEVTVEQAMSWPDEIEIERGTVTEVGRIRAEIRSMGPVNTGAVQEYDRIKERWDFLSEQRADLESAREKIDDAIKEIDTNTRSLFMDTFEAVQKNFDAAFKRLFGGGHTVLTLTNPDDLLETGINVAVQPPGKKMQELALLSGGERALTATALIFALLMTKPSPFVLFDEVDAPLDESNVERFAEVLGEFAASSQFIVITHNRATMEAAASLYGVTMEEPGVSKVISVKLTSDGPTLQDVTEPDVEVAAV